ncbi:MAG: cbb3-type cytochrome c oxidase subunit 3 [Pseudomonadota bacterium]
MTYEALREFSGSWGTILLLAFFTTAIAYALWPSNRSKFNKAAQAPLNDDDIAQEERRS